MTLAAVLAVAVAKVKFRSNCDLHPSLGSVASSTVFRRRDRQRGISYCCAHSVRNFQKATHPPEYGVHAKVHTVALCPSSLCILASLHSVRTAVIGVTL